MNKVFIFLVLTLTAFQLFAQKPMAEIIRERLPQGTKVYGNIPYLDDENEKHLLDIYYPTETEGEIPLVVMVHGGGWIGNDKYGDLIYMPNTVSAILENGMAIASIDYRFAQDATFPLILQDCNQAVSFLYDHADDYGLDMKNVAIIGWSAGGHLASIMGTSQNNKVSDFYAGNSYRPFEYKAVVDYYGPMDLTIFPGSEDEKAPESILIGATPVERPDLARNASPLTYIDKDDPPFLIYHGEKDNIVSNRHSKLLHSWLDYYGVENELTIVKDAPHFGSMYDVEEIKARVIDFLNEHLEN